MLLPQCTHISVISYGSFFLAEIVYKKFHEIILEHSKIQHLGKCHTICIRKVSIIKKKQNSKYTKM